MHEVLIELVRLAGHGEHHLQEILAVGQIVLRIDERLPDRFLVAVGGDRRQLGDQPVDRHLDLFGIVRIQRVLVESRQGADHRRQDRHRVRISGKAVVERPHVLVQHRVPPDRRSKSGELLSDGQLAVNQQVAHLDEIAVLGQDFDRIAAIPQDALGAVQVGDVAGHATCVHIPFIERDQARILQQRRNIQRSLILRAHDHGQFVIAVIVAQLSGVGHMQRPFLLFQRSRRRHSEVAVPCQSCRPDCPFYRGASISTIRRPRSKNRPNPPRARRPTAPSHCFSGGRPPGRAARSGAPSGPATVPLHYNRGAWRFLKPVAGPSCKLSSPRSAPTIVAWPTLSCTW